MTLTTIKPLLRSAGRERSIISVALIGPRRCSTSSLNSEARNEQADTHRRTEHRNPQRR
jgi:hypothetical protein